MSSMATPIPGRDILNRKPALPARVLIAEDEHLVAMNLAGYLSRLSIETIGPIASGKAAIEHAKKEKPDLAMLDICMPDMDGLDVAGVLWKQMRIPAVIVSAFSDDSYILRGTQVGVMGYMLKPVSLDELHVGLALAWSCYHSHRELMGEVAQLKVAMEERKVVERAKGLLMDKLSLSEDAAMKRMQKMARDSRRKLVDLARAILETNEAFESPED
ncbi:MAG: response regulator [Phycisphaera sp.]|nr:response regulator [Phycisphaera sp.]